MTSIHFYSFLFISFSFWEVVQVMHGACGWRGSVFCRRTIAASTLAPYYQGRCKAVSCPRHATGVNLASGCSCDAGGACEVLLRCLKSHCTA